MATHEERIERLELDVDTRLLSLWRLADQLPADAWTLELVSQFMRSAYAAGYNDALVEELRGTLHREHGYMVPTRGRRA